MTTEAEKEGLGEYAKMGFTLDHIGDHFVDLYHEGEFVNRFSQQGATPGSLQAECAKHIKLHHGMFPPAS